MDKHEKNHCKNALKVAENVFENKTEHSFHHYPLAKAIVSYCAMTQYDEHRATILI